MSSKHSREELSTIIGGNSTFKALFERSRSGDQEACRLLYQRYQHHVVRIIRRRFLRANDPLRLLLDSDDLGQLAWNRVFDRIVHGQAAFDDERHFVNFLLTVTENTYRKEHRFYISTSKRSLSRQEPLASAKAKDVSSQSDDPAQAAAANDEYWQFLDDLPVKRRVLIRASLEAGGVPELAKQLGQNEQVVKRAIASLRSKWLHSHDDVPKK